MKTDPRHLWAADKMDIQPADSVLEIGCGPGITAGLVAEKLKKGNITAIDRSKPMIQQALKRNDIFVKQGKATFLAGSFETIALKKRSFNKVYAFNVSFFWKEPGKELAIIKSCLKSKGLLFIFFQPPNGITKPVTDKACLLLEKNDFEVKEVVSAPITCVIATPKLSSL